MNTKWNTTFFLFLGLAAAVLLIYAIMDRRGGRRPIAALAASVFASGALLVIVMGLNDPSKIIRILAAPSKGLSSAVIMQVVIFFMGIATFGYFSKNRVQISLLASAAAVVSVFILGRMYMIGIRPALNTWLVSILLLSFVVQAAVIFAGRDFAENSRYRFIPTAMAVLSGILLSAFVFRTAWLPMQDRALDIHLFVQPPLLFVLCGVALLSVILPLIYSFLFRKYALVSAASPVFGVLHLGGIFLIGVIINQMPLIEKGINNRIFF